MRDGDWLDTLFSLGFLVIVGLAIYGAAQFWFGDDEPPPVPTLTPTGEPSPRPTGLVAVGTDTDDEVWMLDYDSVTGDRNARQGWISIDHSKNADVPYRRSMTLYAVDCDTRAARSPAWTAYNADNSVAHSTNDENAETEFYPPGSMGAAVVQAICNPALD